MPAAKVKDVQPNKRVLVDAPSSRQNIKNDSASKRRKLNGQSKSFKTPGGPGSSQVKSQFEVEVLEKLTQDLDDLKQHNAEKDQQWARPSLDDFDETRDSLCFQQIDAEEGTLHGGKTCVKLFGVTEKGHSVLLHVTDFMHYLYIAAPTSFDRGDCEPYKAYLETHLAQHQPAIYSVQIVQRENLYGFQGNQKIAYLKITVTDPKYINKLRTSIESGGANYKGLWKGAEGGVLTFDSIQYVLRFMIDTKVRLLANMPVSKHS